MLILSIGTRSLLIIWCNYQWDSTQYITGIVITLTPLVITRTVMASQPINTYSRRAYLLPILFYTITDCRGHFLSATCEKLIMMAIYFLWTIPRPCRVSLCSPRKRIKDQVAIIRIIQIWVTRRVFMGNH